MTSEREAVWQRVIQVPTRSLFKRYIKHTGFDKGRATQVLHEYKRFLTLKVRHRPHVVPTPGARRPTAEACFCLCR